MKKGKHKIAKEFQEASQDSERNAEIDIWDTLNVDITEENTANKIEELKRGNSLKKK